MGRLLIVVRLARRDLRHRPGQVVLLLAAITAATATLTLGLALGSVTHQHYTATKAATRGPDVVASTLIDTPAAQQTALARIGTLMRAPGVAAASGPYPVTFTSLAVNGRAQSASVMVEGRGPAPAAVDQPQVTSGTWIGPGEAVVERTFAGALGITVGDRITLDGRSLRVGGIAVTAAVPPEPGICYFFGCGRQLAPFGMANPGLVWLPESDVRSLATPAEPLSYLVNLRLAPGAETGAFAASCSDEDVSSPAPLISDWQCLQATDHGEVRTEQEALLTASWLLALLAMGSVAVLVGGRMAEQIRRAGLVKAAGGTPRLVASVLLAEHVLVGAAAGGLGLLAGHLAAPLVTGPGGALLGAPVTPPVTAGVAVLAVAVAVAIAGAATFVPAARAARTSTAVMLADAARAPSRSRLLTGLSSRLPVTLLLGLRLSVRRPRRTLLGAASVFVAVTGVVAALWARASLDRYDSGPGANGPLDQVLLVVTVGLVLLAVVNAILIAWATSTDARLVSAVARVLGATPGQISLGVALAQAAPALAGALLGLPGGAVLFAILSGPGAVTPHAWWLGAVVLAAAAAVTVLTYVSSQLAGRGGLGPVLRAEG